MRAFTLRGGLVADGDFSPRDLHLVDGRIAATAPADAVVVDARGCLVLPGLVLGHTHLYSALACGMPPPPETPVGFPEILRLVWWRLDRALDLDLVRVSAEVGAWLALRAGVTTLFDHHASPDAIDGSLDAIAAGVEAAGARGVLCYEVTDRNGASGRDAGLAETDRFLARPRALVRGMVGGHAPFTLSDATLERLGDLCRRHDVGFHVHVSEDRTDDVDARRSSRRTPTARLERFGLLRPDSIVAHGVHLSAHERERLGELGVYVAHNPRSNQNNHVGYAVPATQGAHVMLGTDGIGADLFAEGQAAFYAARAHDPSFDAATVQRWLGNARAFAAARFGEPLLGTLAPGAPADVVVLHDRAPTPIGAGSFPWHFVFTLGAGLVRDVFVAGAPRLLDGRAVGLDEAALLERARAAATRLFARMADVAPRGRVEPWR